MSEVDLHPDVDQRGTLEVLAIPPLDAVERGERVPCLEAHVAAHTEVRAVNAPPRTNARRGRAVVPAARARRAFRGVVFECKDRVEKSVAVLSVLLVVNVDGLERFENIVSRIYWDTYLTVAGPFPSRSPRRVC